MHNQTRKLHPSANKPAFITLIIVAVAGILLTSVESTTQAQSNSDEWSTPILLFDGTNQGTIFTPIVVADQSGMVHVFWRFVVSEGDDQTGPQLIYYTRWDGTSWTEPIDVIASSFISDPSMTVDRTGQMHLVQFGPNSQLYYTQAPVSKAHSAYSWSNPTVVEQTNMRMQIIADTTGKLHLVYPGTETSGPFYQTSDDGGDMWSFPVNISRTSLFNASADYVRLVVSNDGTLHAVWTEFQLPDGWPPVGLFYSHSADGGQTWSEAFELAGEGYNQINVATLDDNIVHVVWNGMAGVHGRYHRWSWDGGRTWSETTKLNTREQEGSTGPPPLVVDSGGTMHLLMTDGDMDGDDCLLYSAWQSQRWSEPICISGPEAKTSNYIEEPTMTASEGNRLHAVFWDNRQRLWYTTKQTLSPHVPVVPFPIEVETSAPALSPTTSPTLNPTPHPKPTSAVSWDETIEGNNTFNPGTPLLVAVMPVALFIGIIMLIRILLRHKH
jgi:hypothetical protein